MAANSHHSIQAAIRRIFSIIRLERKDISAIYFYAILFGLIQLSLPLGIQSIINFVLAGSFSTSLVILIAAVTLGVLFTGMLQISQMRLNERIQQNLFTQYSLEFAYRIPRIDMKSVDSEFMPELVNRFFDVVSLQKGLNKLLLDLPVASIQILFGLILLSLYSPVFVIFGVLLVVILGAILRFTSRKGFDTSIEESEYKFAVAAWLQEAGRVMKSLKFSRNTGMHIHRTDKNVAGYLTSRTAHFRVLVFQYWSLVVFKVAITLAMLVVGSILLINQQLNIGQFVASEIVIISVLASVEKLILSLDNVYDLLTAVEKLGVVLDKPIETEGSQKLPAGGALSVEVRNLGFGFDKSKKVLNNISFSAPAGSRVCLVGPEGTGKSTLLRLITGAYNEYEGQILINGIPIGNYELASLRDEIGICFSQQEIFDGTLWQNISMDQCSYTRQEMLQLAAKIGLEPYISSLKDGFETPMDPMGRRLNKMTRQRILLLRALAGNPRLLLLEEPWEGMDETSRNQIISFLFNELSNCTIIVATATEAFVKQAHVTVDLNS